MNAYREPGEVAPDPKTRPKWKLPDWAPGGFFLLSVIAFSVGFYFLIMRDVDTKRLKEATPAVAPTCACSCSCVPYDR